MDDKQLTQLRKATLTVKEKEKSKPTIYFPTGSTLLDIVVGGGEKIGFGMGYPAGTVCRDHGPSGTAKSYKATELIASSYARYKDKFRWRYCDPEYGNTIDTETLYGFNMFPPPEKNEREVVTVEDFEYDVHKWLDSLQPDECGIYVLDSLDSITDQATIERKKKRHSAFDKGKEFDDGTYGMTFQKFLSQEFFRGLESKLEKKNAMIYIISQVRDNVGGGMYAPKDKVSGGRAIGFHETVRILSKVRQKEGSGDRPTGITLKVTAEKVRHPRPFRNCYVSIVFTYGIDNIADCIDFLYDLRSSDTGKLLKRAEACLMWDDIEMSREELIQYIGTNRLQKELNRRVIERWEALEDAVAVSRPPKFADEEE